MNIPKVIKNSTLYSFASFLQKGIGFFLLPVFTRYLTPEDYGVMNLLSSIVGVLSIMIMFSLHGAAKRFHFSYETEKGKASVWGTILIMILFSSLFWTVIVIVFHKYLIDPLTGDISFWKLTILSLLATMLNPVYLLYQTWLQTIEDGKKYTVNMLLNFASTTLLNIIVVVCLGWGVWGMLFSNLIVALIFFAYSLYKFLPIISLHFDKRIAKESLGYSIPLLPHNVSGYLSVMLDRVLLNKLATISQLGIYSVSNQFGLILNTITSSFNQAISPWFFRELNKDSVNLKKLRQFTIGSTLLCSIIAFILVFFTPEVIRFVTTEAYSKAWEPIIFISFGYVLNGLYYHFSTPLFYSKPQLVFIVSFSQLIVNVVMNVALIPHYGYMGAGLSFMMTMFASAVFALLMTSKVYPQCKFPWIRLFMITIYFMAMSSLIFIIEGSVVTIINKIALKIGICLINSFIAYILFKQDIQSILNEVKR